VRTPGEPPPPGAWVFREGKHKPIAVLREDAESDRDHRKLDGTWDGQYHLSVFARPLEVGEEPEECVGELFEGYRQVKWFLCAQLQTLTAAGFTLAASPPEPYHYDVLLGTELTDSVLMAFDRCLEAEPRRNRR